MTVVANTLFALGAVWAVASCQHRDSSPVAPKESRSAVVAVQGEVLTRVLMTGTVSAASSETLVVPRTETWTQSIRWLAADGSPVSVGEKIVEFDNSTFVSKLEEMKLAANRAANELARQRTDNGKELAEKQFAVQREQIALEKARLEASVGAELSPKRVYQEKQLALEQAEVALERARDQLEAAATTAALTEQVKSIAYKKALREIERVRRVIASLSLTAPKSGILMIARNPREDRKLQVGDTVWPGLTVAEIPDLAQMQVTAQLSDVDDGAIVPGMLASCFLDSYPKVLIPGVVNSIAPVAKEPERNSLRRAFDVTIALKEQPPEMVRPGMSVKVVIEASRQAGVLVPRAALDLGRQPARVGYADGRWVEVKLAACDAHYCILDPPPAPGTRLVPSYSP